MNIFQRFATWEDKSVNMGVIFRFFQGRSTFFAMVFMTVGIILAFMGKLTTEYLGIAASVQTLLVTRSIAQDYHDRACKNGGKDEVSAEVVPAPGSQQ